MALPARNDPDRVMVLRVGRRYRAAATRNASAGEKLMFKPAVRRCRLGSAALAAASLLALAGALPAAEYKMTVSRERLINAQNEPQNWLMMNGDYGSMRYSKLSQINRDNVKN